MKIIENQRLGNMVYERREDEIIDLLKEADEIYYNSFTEESKLSDEEYDNLKEYAQEKWPNNEYFNLVGAIPEKAIKINHDYVLGSLKKFKPETLDKWLVKYPKDMLFVVMPKLDGVSFFVRYENGILTKATTRGDGYLGFDLTHKAKKFLPLKIKSTETIDLRGECLLSKSKASELGFANPRNGVSGILNRDGVENCEHVDVLFYEYINSTNNSLIKDFELLSELNLPVVEYRQFSNLKISELKDVLESMKTEYVYNLDGLVICPENYKRENVERPDNKIAFKVNSEGVEAEVDHIEWNTTRTGKIVPVAVFKDAVLIDGSNVLRASCYNAKYVTENKIGTNSKVKIIKSGDIIPKIIDVLNPATGIIVPTTCSSCGNTLKSNDTDLICSKGLSCKEQLITFLEYFFKTLGSENISSQTFRNLGISSFNDVFELSEESISKLDGFGSKKAKVIINEISDSIKNVEPEVFLAAIGIPNFGLKNTKKYISSLDSKLSNQEKFRSVFHIAEKMFTSISGFGISIFNSVISNRDRIEYVYDVCKRHGLTFNEETLSEGIKNVVKVTVTGKGPYGRKDLEKMFLEKGFEIIDFSSETQFLICDDLDSSSSKMKKAKKNNIKILTYGEFFNEYM